VEVEEGLDGDGSELLARAHNTQSAALAGLVHVEERADDSHTFCGQKLRRTTRWAISMHGVAAVERGDMDRCRR